MGLNVFFVCVFTIYSVLSHCCLHDCLYHVSSSSIGTLIMSMCVCTMFSLHERLYYSCFLCLHYMYVCHVVTIYVLS